MVKNLNEVAIHAGVVVVILATLTGIAIGSNYLGNETLAVLAGAVCGVGAAIPTSLLIIAIARRRNERQALLADANLFTESSETEQELVSLSESTRPTDDELTATHDAIADLVDATDEALF